jgi:nucleotide-binding universal stress UspA family protein
MLVVGRHGHGRIGRLLIGSTAEAVAHEAQLPVVVVPEKWTPGDGGQPIVVGVDESEQCEHALEFAVAIATERRVPVRMAHVWDVDSIYSWDAMPTSGTVEEWRDHYARRLEQTAQLWRDKYPEIHFQTELHREHPVYGLLNAAREADAQLLVLGGRTHSRLRSLLLGSTARGVLHHATCPIAIVHQSHNRP